MEKVGRNDSCPCGSGKKFKRCCMEQAEVDSRISRLTAERGRLVAQRASAERELAALAEEAELTELELRTESVLELIDAGHVEEAETTAQQLLVEFPEDTVVIERLAQVYEAKGEALSAAEQYRRGVALMDAEGDGGFCQRARDIAEI